MSKFRIDEIEELLDDESLSNESRREMLKGDEEALSELAWLTAERALFAQRASRSRGAARDNWQAISSQLKTPRDARSHWWSRLRNAAFPKLALGSLALAGVAAAVLVLYTSTEAEQVAEVREPPHTSVSDTDEEVAADSPSDKLARADAAIVEAELAFLSAVDLLEDAYLQEKPTLSADAIARVDEEFKETRALLKHSRDGQQKNMSSRRRLLSAYGKRLRSLQSTMIALNERSQ